MFSATQIEKIKRRLRSNKSKQLLMAFHALSDACRLYIFRLLIVEQEVCVTDVAKICEISVPAASQQLKILELTGIVRKERMGQMVCYNLQKKDPIIQTLIKLMSR